MPVPYADAVRLPNGRLVPGQELIKDGKIFKVVANAGGRRRPVRRPISKATRERVKRRDRGTCRYCGRYDIVIHIDHVVPVALGGSNRLRNLVVACDTCNQRKGARVWTPKPLRALLRT